MTTTLAIHLLGDFRLLHGDAPVNTLNPGRLQSLLAWLLLHRAAPQSRQQLAYLFWPDSSDAQARTNLRNAIFQLRAALPEADRFLQVDTQTIQWRSDADFWLDVAEFEGAIQVAQQASDPSAKRAALVKAATLYTGDLMSGCYEDWIAPAREQLQQSYALALEQLIALLESQQEYRTAIEYAQRLLQFDPLRETSYGRLMHLHALAGDRATALRIYHTCTTTLARELGVDPDPTTRSLYEHILNLEAPQPAVSRVREAAPLVGRERAWAQLQESWRGAARGHPTFLLVGGEAGIGKTRLVEEFLVWAQRQGVAVAAAHCYAIGGNLALAPVQEWLRAPIFERGQRELAGVWASEVARLLPELLTDRPELTPPAPLSEAWQRQRFLEALARLILHSGEPCLLFIDDIQWCDTDTLEFVQYLLHFSPKARLLVVSTLRREEMDAARRLAPLLRQLGRAGQLVEVELARLTAEETTQLTANLLGRPLPPELADSIFAETEGNPLFIVETVRAELSKGVRGWGSGGDKRSPTPLSSYPPTPLPPKVLSVIQSRLDQLSPQALELACVAAVVGRAFSVEVLARASESDEDSLVRGLDELWQQRIIRERSSRTPGAETYDFAHDKLREVAYASLSPILRRFLHRRVAQALESTHAANLDPVYVQIATHYEQAGLMQLALDAYRRAAQVAHERSAFSEAIALLDHALTLLAPSSESAEHSRQELAIQAARGPLLLITKGYAAPEVEEAFQRAWALCQQVGDLSQRFQSLWGLGRFYFVQPNPVKGLEVSQQLLALAQEAKENGLLMEAFCSLGTHYFHRAAFPDARRYLEEALALYDPTRHSDHALIYGQDPFVVSSAYLAWTLWCLGETRAALTHANAALARAHELNHPYSIVIALTYASVQQHFLDDPLQCRVHAEAAIALADKYGFTLWLSMVTFLRGWAKTRQEDFDAGFADMQTSIDLFRSTGAELGAAYFVALLAEAFGRSGSGEAGVIIMQQVFDLVERTQDRWSEAELYRVQAELHLLLGATAEAETVLQQALSVAQAQGARQWELRAALRLGQLWQTQGRLAEGQTLLSTICQWFDEDAETPDLRTARLLVAGA